MCIRDRSYFVRDYPIFGLDPAERSFTCLGTEDNGRLRLRKLVAEVRPELVPVSYTHLYKNLPLAYQKTT